jgi:hypothetical protein
VTPDFYLDENVSDRLVPALHDLGYDAVTTTQLGTKGATDPQQLLTATRLGRVVVTHNSRDFRMLHEALRLWAELWNLVGVTRHAGILMIEAESGMKAAAMARVLVALAQAEADFTDRLFAWNGRTGWQEIGWFAAPPAVRPSPACSGRVAACVR